MPDTTTQTVDGAAAYAMAEAREDARYDIESTRYDARCDDAEDAEDDTTRTPHVCDYRDRDCGRRGRRDLR